MISPEILLKQVPLFRSLRTEDTSRLAALLQRQTLAKGDVLCRKGDEGNSLYMIIAGKIKIVRHAKDGDEVILAILNAGDFCGEMVLLDGLPRSADAIAVEDTVIYALTRSDFFACVVNNERAVRTILATLSKRLRNADDFLDDIFSLNVGARLLKKLLELASSNGASEQGAAPILLHTSQTTIAGMIGTSRESVNKELRILREQGLIEIVEKKIVILDLEKLRKKSGNTLE
jgi:CRP-like cAMP-binding protein